MAAEAALTKLAAKEEECQALQEKNQSLRDQAASLTLARATLQEQARQQENRNRSGASDQHSAPPPTPGSSGSTPTTPDGLSTKAEMAHTITALKRQVEDLTYDLKKYEDFS